MTLIIGDSRPRELTVRVTPDPAEAVRAGRDLQRARGRGWFSWAIYPMLLVLAAMYLASGVPLRDLWRLGVVAAALGALHVAVPLLQRRQFRRHFASSPTLRGPQVYTLSDSGVVISGGPSTLSLGWDAFVRARESREFFFLFTNDRCAYYLPKRVIGGPAEESELRALLDAHLGSRSEARP